MTWRMRSTPVCRRKERSAGSSIRFSAGLIADVYDQMAASELTVFTKTGDDVDSMSFFFIRGETAVRVFDRELRFFSRPDDG